MSTPVDSDEWPGKSYDKSKRDCMLALGLAVSRFNKLEYEMMQKFLHYLGLNESIAVKVWRNLQTDKCLDILRAAITECSYPLEVKDAEYYFLDGFSACAENRNILGHASPVYGPETVYFLKSSAKNPAEQNTYIPSLFALRRVADDIENFQRFGWGTRLHVFKNHAKPSPGSLMERVVSSVLGGLPDKPPRPHRLSPYAGPTLLGIPYSTGSSPA